MVTAVLLLLKQFVLTSPAADIPSPYGDGTAAEKSLNALVSVLG